MQCNRITCRFGVNRLTNGLRGGYVRVADREIEYVLAANDHRTSVSVLEQLADRRTRLPKSIMCSFIMVIYSCQGFSL